MVAPSSSPPLSSSGCGSGVSFSIAASSIDGASLRERAYASNQRQPSSCGIRGGAPQSGHVSCGLATELLQVGLDLLERDVAGCAVVLERLVGGGVRAGPGGFALLSVCATRLLFSFLLCLSRAREC